MIEKIDTVVVGAGQAGLAMSYHLKQSGREHVILERGRAAQSWLERALGLVDVPVSQFVYPTTRVVVRDRRPGWLRSEIRAECSSDRRPVALQLPGRGAAIERCIRPPSTRHRARNDRSKACRRCDRPVPNPAYSGFWCLTARRHISSSLARLSQSTAIAIGSGSGRGERRIRLPDCRRASSGGTKSFSFGGPIS